ncbi:oligosaccharide flippase family protein [Stakelama sp. CBK3Z-3]|uniref:Oligosaccharide flippase family protein n=1 Tax=Stakelama flava TaxID=2860338 RepID=A0ABS6XJ37_9SPHN|nr:oligosaccharide flippase family protein [Stakelama flava]MBW4329899.1 oligosaccharide flippase family protein [Stakelama flava]
MSSVDELVGRAVLILPFGANLAKLQNRLASFAEQGIQGVANVAVNIILARNLTHEGFASIGTMIGIHFFVLGLHRTAIVLPFILDAGGDEDAERAAERRWWWLNLLSLAVIAAVLAGGSALASYFLTQPSARWFVQGLAHTVLVTPTLLFFEFGRRILYQRRLPITAALASALYMLLLLGIAYLVTRTPTAPAVAALAWVAAGLGGGAVATIAAPPGRPQVIEGIAIWWNNRSFAFWQALTNLPYAVYNSSVVVAIGMFGGATAAAAYTAARTLTNPAMSMVTAVDSLDKPRAARALVQDGLRGLRHSVGRTRRLLILVTGGYLGMLAIFAGPVLHFAFGDTYDHAVNEIRVLALAFFLMCLNQPSETFLIVLRESKILLVTRMIAAGVALLSLWFASPYGLMGACLALLVTHVINLADLRIGEMICAGRWTRRQPADPTPVSAAGVTTPDSRLERARG